MLNDIKISKQVEEDSDELLRFLSQRFLNEQHRSITSEESESCWWVICGIIYRSGKAEGLRYINSVKLLDLP